MLSSTPMVASDFGVIVEMEKLRNLESGLGQVCLHLGRSLAEVAPSGLGLQFYVPKNRFGIFGEKSRYHAVRTWDRWWGVSSPRCSLWHSTHQDSRYWPRSRRVRVLLTVHDLNFLQPGSRPAARNRRLRHLQSAVSRAAAVVVPSRFTETELRRNIKVLVPVHLIPWGHCLDEVAPRRPEWLPGGKFLLSLGHIHPKKNLHVLLPLLLDHPDLRLVLAGTRDHPYAGRIELEAERLGLPNRVLLPGPVTDDVRLWLFRNCEALLQPSLAEGFGLPVLEAMSQGRPVFLSRRTSLPEIGGDNAFYWDEFEPARMTRILDEGLRLWAREPERAEKARRWAAQFTWPAAASHYLALYRELIAAAGS
jgi:glycosyltransferase involved in cell wall biosynthesis